MSEQKKPPKIGSIKPHPESLEEILPNSTAYSQDFINLINKNPPNNFLKSDPVSNDQSINKSFEGFNPSYSERKLDICGICHKKYNVGDKIPRILVNCGHTYCTSCLGNYQRNNKIRCPFCKKIVKHLENVETLPLNLPIFSEIVKNDPDVSKFIETSSKNSFITHCERHSKKQKHFYCSFHNNNFCRECIKPYHGGESCCIVDLFDIHKLFLINNENNAKNEQIIQFKNKKNNE